MENYPVQKKLRHLPDKPGVYLFKDEQGRVIYIGKAVSLRKRVASYFQPGRPHAAKIDQMVRRVTDLDWVVTGSEAEALLMESGLVKENRPKYNVSLRDDKSYAYLNITADEKYPRLFVGRGKTVRGVRRIGPFTGGFLLRQAFLAIRQILPFRTCKTMPKRACLDYHMGLCEAPCEGRISPEAYAQTVSKVLRLMSGKKDQVMEELRAKMQQASQAHNYEEAARLRNQIDGLLQMTVRPAGRAVSQGLADLQSVLHLPRPPLRIEGFDISNIYGRQPVGSMVTFSEGKPLKDHYRRFKIETIPGINDYAMMQEMIRRRYGPGELSGTLPVPDLVLIDGGKGHLNAALEVLRELKLDLPAIGIAKEFEQLFFTGRDKPIELPPQSKALQLLQRVRDEAHRFAVGYHRLLRGKAALRSSIDGIPGIGPLKKKALLDRFGSVKGIRGASAEEIAQVPGFSPVLARRIVEALQ